MHKIEVFVVGFVRPWGGRYPLAAQTAAMEAAGIKRVYDDRELLIRQRRPNDRVAIHWLHLLTDPKRKYRRRDLLNALHALEEKGAHVLELATGRTTEFPKTRDMMLVDAMEALGLGRVPSRNTRQGRPSRLWSEKDLSIIRLHWHSGKHATDGAAVEAIRAAGVRNISASIIRKLPGFGNSGRPFGRRK